MMVVNVMMVIVAVHTNPIRTPRTFVLMLQVDMSFQEAANKFNAKVVWVE
jgi:hypothetical protein